MYKLWLLSSLLISALFAVDDGLLLKLRLVFDFFASLFFGAFLHTGSTQLICSLSVFFGWRGSDDCWCHRSSLLGDSGMQRWTLLVWFRSISIRKSRGKELWSMSVISLNYNTQNLDFLQRYSFFNLFWVCMWSFSENRAMAWLITQV